MKNIYLYRITNIDNLENILRRGFILCKNKMIFENMDYINIAYEEIQDRRSRFIVPIEPCGVLHDYVPFYFAPRSPMLYAIHKGCVHGYDAGQDSIIYLFFSLDSILSANLDFVYTDGHPIMALSSFYNDIAQIKEIVDWNIMKSRYWHDTDEYIDRKRRRQAEFLIHDSVQMNLLAGIAVINNNMLTKVENILSKCNNDIIKVIVRPTWYY